MSLGIYVNDLKTSFTYFHVTFANGKLQSLYVFLVLSVHYKPTVEHTPALKRLPHHLDQQTLYDRLQH